MTTHKKPTAFQGERGAFSHAAAMKLLGANARVIPCATFKDAFEALRSGEASNAVLPIENTLHGSIHENYDYLLEYGFSISGETSIRISHQLIALPGVPWQRVRRVLSHPVALNQCRIFLSQHKHLEVVPTYDTAGSVKLLSEEKLTDAAAIASKTAAETYGGRVLKSNIEDDRRNFTRFFLLTKQKAPRPARAGGWKTSIVFATANRPGALFRAMACFALRDINLTKIESRPLRGKPWEYLFYVDLLGSEEDSKLQRALDNLKEITDFFRVLGSYLPTP